MSDIPDKVIDQAVKEAEISLSPERPDGRHLRGTVEAVAPLLIEHGAERERVKWEARIEKLADHLNQLADGADLLLEKHPYRVAARLLRSLLTEEEA